MLLYAIPQDLKVYLLKSLEFTLNYRRDFLMIPRGDARLLFLSHRISWCVSTLREIVRRLLHQVSRCVNYKRLRTNDGDKLSFLSSVSSVFVEKECNKRCESSETFTSHSKHYFLALENIENYLSCCSLNIESNF